MQRIAIAPRYANNIPKGYIFSKECPLLPTAGVCCGCDLKTCEYLKRKDRVLNIDRHYIIECSYGEIVSK
jgi:hypothetical protein